MLGQRCSNCGYGMSFLESASANLDKKIDPRMMAVGINTLSNANNLKCPNCGEVSRWIKDDE